MKSNLIKYYLLFVAFQAFKNNQKGVTAIEYGLIALSIGAMMLIALHGDNGLALAIKARIEQLATLVNNAVFSS